MREIVLDTETTGRDPLNGDRIVEIGCVELVNHLPTGRVFQRYLDPERDSEPGALAVHGLTREFLSGHKRFADEVEDFLAFVGDDPLVIQNAAFDMGFLNAELRRLGRPTLPMDRAIDTLKLAQRKFPGQRVSLDALCDRFRIDRTHRTLHGALLDAELTALVYLELLGGRQVGLGLEAEELLELTVATSVTIRPPRVFAPSPEELEAHAAFLATIKDPIWTLA
ncbi:DNA polymerase III subunit epsilon [Zavarzinia sp. CC-PAN008]|uniref:DNA polymerase III subunit epsilon n=1 Tax=Zavarzinia sp. CC-PAN008 TaxID=3243332 RepID=UPI003F74404F